MVRISGRPTRNDLKNFPAGPAVQDLRGIITGWEQTAQDAFF
jgi:hypothetical protein